MVSLRGSLGRARGAIVRAGMSVWAWVRASAQDLLFFAGLVLLATGAGWVYPPAGLMTAGCLLVWISIPTRHFPIVFRSPKEPR